MNSISLQFGNVQNKNIKTPNQFVSHMLEHIAWRLNCEIFVSWDNTDYKKLGKTLGQTILKFKLYQSYAIAFGNIDDGSAIVEINQKKKSLNFSTVKNINKQWFLNSRCEQLSTGKPLLDLLSGLANGLQAGINIRVCSFKDPHHTWEGVFRGVGIALNKMFTPPPKKVAFKKFAQPSLLKSSSLQIKELNLRRVAIQRITAETFILLEIDFNKAAKNQLNIQVDNSINVSQLPRLLNSLCKNAGFALKINFSAKVLSSSHVVWEDIGLVLGRALLEIAKLKMQAIGINGAGSNLKKITDAKKKLKVAFSLEGRKFWEIFPSAQSYAAVQKNLLIGQNIFGNLRSEDLDDFFDGFCGGMNCSLIVSAEKITSPLKFWTALFSGTGLAIKETFLPNPQRKGLPPGVKATLS